MSEKTQMSNNNNIQDILQSHFFSVHISQVFFSEFGSGGHDECSLICVGMNYGQLIHKRFCILWEWIYIDPMLCFDFKSNVMRECLCGLKTNDSPILLLVPMKSEVTSAANIDNLKETRGSEQSPHDCNNSRYTEKIHTQWPVLPAALSSLIPKRAGHLLQQAPKVSATHALLHLQL